ncbi:hypothetical protein CATRI_09540 [Corynebacterium atrinae]|uniref:GAP family protein n=1 Tax=Corynebacterium atrinae TaxID=1336740 RepID=UPI0025B4C75B|nr:GAP family protein [Corynebacterium atrinae]WJY63976.1 hypothetical protein CATRI_09540 [Corynebacterium atrinae]
MVHLFAVLIPMTLAAAVSPMMLSEQLLLLSGQNGRRSARAYAAGSAVVLVVLIALVQTIGASLELPKAPKLSAGMDIGLGLVLLGLALFFLRHKPKPKEHKKHGLSARDAFGFGVFAMATNFTTMPLVIAASKDVSASGVSVIWMALALLFLLAGACLPGWGPLLLSRSREGQRALEKIAHIFEKYSRSLVVAGLLLGGVIFLSKGLLGVL